MNSGVQSISNIGLIGLGVMGQNLTLNIERNGFSISVYERVGEVLDSFMAAHPGKQIYGSHSPDQFVKSLERPRKIVLLVKAGDPVDWTIKLIKPYLEPGDIIVDSGNSYFKDTERRQNELKAAGIYLVGSGTSGGEKGALWGPSLMPGGAREAYEQIRPIWEAIAAKVADGPCVTYIGKGGSGHFVKMVHNGIEYGDMQLIAEAYDLLRRLLGYSAAEIAEVFTEWNRGDLESYLIEITAEILRVKDEETGKPLVELILDKAGQKGTGKWTSQVAQDLSVAIPTIEAALVSRNISALKDERVKASREINGPKPEPLPGNKQMVVAAIREALYASKICSYAQGLNLIRAGSDQWQWGIDLSEVARIWQGGCIIRARFLGEIKKAFKRQPDLRNLLLDSAFKKRIEEAQSGWRFVVCNASQQGIPALAMAASLSYFDMYRTASLPLNLTQAQRDLFGSHAYERIDKPELGAVHTDWEKLLKKAQL
jgi:6-phosphogluconate dehydrogenase